MKLRDRMAAVGTSVTVCRAGADAGGSVLPKLKGDPNTEGAHLAGALRRSRSLAQRLQPGLDPPHPHPNNHPSSSVFKWASGSSPARAPWHMNCPEQGSYRDRSRLVGARGWEDGERGATGDGYGLSFTGDENVLKLDCDGDYTLNGWIL